MIYLTDQKSAKHLNKILYLNTYFNSHVFLFLWLLNLYSYRHTPQLNKLMLKYSYNNGSLSDSSSTYLKAKIHCEPFFQSISWSTVSRHFMKHEILSWNAFALVPKFHCVCLSSIKKLCLQGKYIFWQQNLIALILINNVSCS